MLKHMVEYCNNYIEGNPFIIRFKTDFNRYK